MVKPMRLSVLNSVMYLSLCAERSVDYGYAARAGQDRKALTDGMPTLFHSDGLNVGIVGTLDPTAAAACSWLSRQL